MAAAVVTNGAPAKAPGEEEFAFKPDNCMYCGDTHWEAGFGPNTIIKCSCCLVKCMHVGCAQKAGREVTEAVMAPDAIVTCSTECEQLFQRWQKRTGQRLDLEEDPSYNLHVLKYKEGDKVSKTSVDAALKIFRSSFTRLQMDNGRDLFEMVCTGYESPAPPEGQEEDEEEDLYNFGEFRLLVLRKGANIVTVATLRIFGPNFAELPFISTRDGYRREGHCRRLIKAVDKLLQTLGVRWLVVPSMKPVLKMWLNKFNCQIIPEVEQQILLDCEIVGMDPDTTVLVRRRVGSPFAPVAAGPSKSVSSKKLTTRAAGRPAARGRGGHSRRGRGGARGGGRGGGRSQSAASNGSGSDDSSTSSSSSEDDKSDDSDFEATVGHDDGEDEEKEDSSSSESVASGEEVTSPPKGGHGAGRGRGRGRGRGGAPNMRARGPASQPEGPVIPKPPRKTCIGPPQIGREHLHPSFQKGGAGLAPFTMLQGGVPVNPAGPSTQNNAAPANNTAEQGAVTESAGPTAEPSAAGALAQQPSVGAGAASSSGATGGSQSARAAPAKPPACRTGSAAPKRPPQPAGGTAGGKRANTQQQAGPNKKPRKAAARRQSAEAKRNLLVKQKLAVLRQLKEGEVLLKTVEAAEITVRAQLVKDDLVQQLTSELDRERARMRLQAQQLQAQASYIQQQAAMLRAAGLTPPGPPATVFSQLPASRSVGPPATLLPLPATTSATSVSDLVTPATLVSELPSTATMTVTGTSSLVLPAETGVVAGAVAKAVQESNAGTAGAVQEGHEDTAGVSTPAACFITGTAGPDTRQAAAVPDNPAAKAGSGVSEVQLQAEPAEVPDAEMGAAGDTLAANLLADTLSLCQTGTAVASTDTGCATPAAAAVVATVSVAATGNTIALGKSSKTAASTGTDDALAHATDEGHGGTAAGTHGADTGLPAGRVTVCSMYDELLAHAASTTLQPLPNGDKSASLDKVLADGFRDSCQGTVMQSTDQAGTAPAAVGAAAADPRAPSPHAAAPVEPVEMQQMTPDKSAAVIDSASAALAGPPATIAMEQLSAAVVAVVPDLATPDGGQPMDLRSASQALPSSEATATPPADACLVADDENLEMDTRMAVCIAAASQSQESVEKTATEHNSMHSGADEGAGDALNSIDTALYSNEGPLQLLSAAAVAAVPMSAAALPPAVPGTGKVLPAVINAITGSGIEQSSPVLMASPRSRDSFHNKLTQQLLPSVLSSWLNSPSSTSAGPECASPEHIAGVSNAPNQAGAAALMDDAANKSAAVASDAVAADGSITKGLTGPMDDIQGRHDIESGYVRHLQPLSAVPHQSQPTTSKESLPRSNGPDKQQLVSPEHGPSADNADVHITASDSQPTLIRPNGDAALVEQLMPDAATATITKLRKLQESDVASSKQCYQPSPPALGRASGLSLLSSRAPSSQSLVDAIFGSVVSPVTSGNAASGAAATGSGSGLVLSKGRNTSSSGRIAAAREPADPCTPKDKHIPFTYECGDAVQSADNPARKAAQQALQGAQPVEGSLQPARSMQLQAVHAHRDDVRAATPISRGSRDGAACGMDGTAASGLTELFATEVDLSSPTPTRVSAGEAGLLVLGSPAGRLGTACTAGTPTGLLSPTYKRVATGPASQHVMQQRQAPEAATARPTPVQGASREVVGVRQPSASAAPRPALLTSLVDSARSLLGKKRTASGHIVSGSKIANNADEGGTNSSSRRVSMSELWVGHLQNVSDMAVSSDMQWQNREQAQPLPRTDQIQGSGSQAWQQAGTGTSADGGYKMLQACVNTGPGDQATVMKRTGISLLHSRQADSGCTTLDRIAESEDDSVGAMRIAAKFCWNPHPL